MDKGSTPNRGSSKTKSDQRSRISKLKSNQERRTSNSGPDRRVPRQKKAAATGRAAAAAAAAAAGSSYRSMPPFTTGMFLDEPGIRIQPPTPRSPISCWNSIPHDAFVAFLNIENSPEHKTECMNRLQLSLWNDNDLFSSWIGNPRHVEKYPLYSQAPELPLYDADLVSVNRFSMELDFLKHANWLYSSFDLNAGSVVSVQLNFAPNAHFCTSQRFQRFLISEMWVTRIGEQRGDFPSNIFNQCVELCNKVADFTTLVEALVSMCWLGLYITYEGQFSRQPFEDVKASYCVEARRWCVRILRTWAEEEAALLSSLTTSVAPPY